MWIIEVCNYVWVNSIGKGSKIPILYGSRDNITQAKNLSLLKWTQVCYINSSNFSFFLPMGLLLTHIYIQQSSPQEWVHCPFVGSKTSLWVMNKSYHENPIHPRQLVLAPSTYNLSLLQLWKGLVPALSAKGITSPSCAHQHWLWYNMLGR